MAVDILKLYEEVQNGEGNKRTGITKEIIEETVKVMKILKEKKQTSICNPAIDHETFYNLIASLLNNPPTGATIEQAEEQHGYPYLVVNGVHSVTMTINDIDYKMEIEKVGEQDKLYVSTPIDFNEIEFSIS